MRIQETDKILKQSRNSRRSAPPRPGFFARLWHGLTALFK
jgi:hypothetical protein